MALLILVVAAAVILLIGFRSRSRRAKLKLVIGGLLGLNGLLVIGAAAFVLHASPAYPQQQPDEAAAEQSPTNRGEQGGSASGVPLAAALAVGLGAIGAGFAVGISGSAAMGAIAQRPETFGRALVFVGLAEGIAIYGLIISFMILTR